MFITNNDDQIAKLNVFVKWLLLITFNLLASTQSTASELTVDKINTMQYSISHGSLKKDLNEQRRNEIIESNKQTQLPDQLNGKATSKNRKIILNSQNSIITKSHKGLTSRSYNRDFSADFSIYGAISLLQDDYDGDGFFQTFSVIFDADIYSYTENQFGEVYALLYISKNGGPWTHYFTTDNFIIEADMDFDEYEVNTTFLSGYESDYYDVLIDLYQVGFSELVATYSSNDNNALYALPLESADYDEPYFEIIETNAGSICWLSLLLLTIGLFRLKANTLIR